MRARVELLDIKCHDTEDWIGADTFYMVGGISDGFQHRGILTRRLWINDRQTRVFDSDQRMIFDAEVPVGRTIHIGLQAWDEDAAKDWERYGEAVEKLTRETADQIEQIPRDPANKLPEDPRQGPDRGPDLRQIAAAILRAGGVLAGWFMRPDTDDRLGTLSSDIAVPGIPNQIRNWDFSGTWAGTRWSYTVRYRIVQDYPIVPSVRSLQSLNAPEHFIRHRDFLADITGITSELDQYDASFVMVPGLADNSGISFQAVNSPGRYLRHEHGRLKLHQREDTPLFREDATFYAVPGLADPSMVSFVSFNYPGAHIRHRDFQLYVEGDTGEPYKQDATFRIVGPFKAS